MVLSGDFKKVFLLRFLGYAFIQIGLLSALLIVEPVIISELKYRLENLVGYHHVLPKIVTSINQNGELSASVSGSESFGNLIFGGSNIITPVDTNFGIVIEKINANSRVIDVDASNEQEYTVALGKGVAHAEGTAYPGQKGNIFLFSHSVQAPWEVVRFNAVFYLLRDLVPGDRIVMFYKNRRYDYIVFDKTIVDPSDTHFLTDSYNESILTLQTCDPPGTLSHRLIVRARLASNS